MTSPYDEGTSPLTPDTADELDLGDSPSASPLAENPLGSLSLPAAVRNSAHRAASDTATVVAMTASSSPLAGLNAARRPPGQPAPSPQPTRVTGSLQERMKAFQASRRGAPPTPGNAASPQTPGAVAGGPLTGGSLQMPFRPAPGSVKSAPVVPGRIKGGLAAKRGLGLKLSDAQKPAEPSANGQPADGDDQPDQAGKMGSAFKKYAEYVDTDKGIINFKGKAVLHGSGIDFAGGQSFTISLDEVDTLEELGKGNYGTVYKVRHSRPRVRRPGLGLAGNKAPSSLSRESTGSGDASLPQSPVVRGTSTSGMVMAMKELRLELDDSKFQQIIMELDVLHRCVSPFIVDFYGAFFQEGAVYICMEFMDGSIDKLYGDGIPEGVLRKVALSTVMGLKSLKDEHNIIHRDVKPTNILVNTRGQIKICDFGVSGNLVASIAKTNIGCQSYMAPERISSGGVAQAGAVGGTYSVQSDIWSLGLSIIECATGRYPYPPETYNNIFSQLSAIVDGEPPDLPAEGYSDDARDFVHSCLNKVAKSRPTYAMLLRHPWLAPLLLPPTISEEEEETTATEEPGPDIANGLGSTPPTADKEVAAWVIGQLEKKRLGKMQGAQKPALHAAPLAAVPSGGEAGEVPPSAQPVAAI